MDGAEATTMAKAAVETEVTVTLSETATGTFWLGDAADADSLRDAVTEKACQGTISCEVTAEDGERRRLDTTATYNLVRTFAPDAEVYDIDAVFTEAAEEDGVTDAETTSATLSASAAVERQAASADSTVDSALADPAAVASIQSAGQDVAGAGSVTVAVEERAPPPPPPPPPPPRAGGGGRDDGDGEGGGDGGGGGGLPIAAVAGGAGGGVVLLLVAGAIYYCRRNKARAQTQHQTRHSAGEKKAAKGAKPTAAADGRGDYV